MDDEDLRNGIIQLRKQVSKETEGDRKTLHRLTPEMGARATCGPLMPAFACVCLLACDVWPSGLIADRGHPVGVTTLASLRSDSRPVCTVSCQPLHIYKAVLLLVKQSGGEICIVVSLLVPFTRPVPLPSHSSTSQRPDHFDPVVLNL